MIDFKSIFFGYADADTEADRNPEDFKRVFFDPHNYLDELINRDRYIIYGRKGDGKTAYSAQIRLTADERNIYAYPRSLNNFNNSVFSQIKTYDTLGGNPYISFWKCVLLLEYVGMIHRYEPNIQQPEYINLIDALNKFGFLSIDNDISVTVTKLVEMDSSITIKAFQHGRKYEHIEELHGAEQIYSSIRKIIRSIYLKKRFIFLLDGLDDILSYCEFKPEIITGLIRAVDDINRYFRNTTLSVKCLIFIRSDILNLCRDPNLSKIIRDSGIKLSWAVSDNPFASNLLQLVSKRIDTVSGRENSVEQFWYETFPETIGSRNSTDYILENIIYRPRDLLQFFIEAQKECTRGKKLTVEKISTALTRYSEEYFVDAMRDELTGFFPNETVTALPEVLSKMGEQYFYLATFESECNKHAAFDGVSPRQILEKLFEAGYIGQHRPRAKFDYTVFSYRNSREKFQDDHECVLHRGLLRALTI